MARKINTMTEALMLVGGGVVGAGLALLLAPQSGKKSRREMARFSRSMGKKSDKMVRNISHTMTGFTDKMGEFSEKMGGMTLGMLNKR